MSTDNETAILDRLRESISLLTATLEATAEGILVVNPQGHVNLYNRQFLSLWNIPEEVAARNDDRELLGFVLGQLTDPDSFIERVNWLYGHPDQESNDILHFKDGRVFRRFSKPQRLGEEIIGRVWSFRDITERTKVERELQEVNTRYELVVASSRQIVYDYDYDSGRIVWGGSIAEVLGYSKEEMGDIESWTARIHPDDRPQTLKLLDEAAAGNLLFDAEYRFLNKAGSYQYILDRGFFLTNIEGPVHRMLGMMADITERKKSELKIREQNTRLGAIAENLMRKNEQLEEFTQIVSHNLRSPVGNIATLIDLVSQEKDPTEIRKMIDYLRESCKSLLLTLNELNDVLKVKQSGSIEKQTLHLREVFSKVKSMFHNKISRLSASVTADFSEAETIEYPNIYAESIFLNLLSNALKYHHPDRRPEIHFRSYRLDKTPYLEVRDNGIGIDMDQFGHQVFKMRKTFHDRPDSRGIGLFMIRNQVEAMGGEITVQSQVDAGTTFTVQFTKHP
jgi:PAS domain S-box-containing protein